MNLQAIYAHLPETICPPDCGICCEHAQPFASRGELEAIRKYCAKNGIPFHNFAENFHYIEACPYLNDHLCVIHEVRPFFCRVVGSVERRECSKCSCEKVLPFDKAQDLFVLLFHKKSENRRTATHFARLEQEQGGKIYA